MRIGNNIGHVSSYIVDSKLHLMKPRLKRTLGCRDIHIHMIRGHVAGELNTQRFAILIRKRVAVVTIQSAVAWGSRIDLQSEGAAWSFIDILHNRLLGNDASAFHENWKRIECRIEFNLFSACDLCTSPEVIPITCRQ